MSVSWDTLSCYDLDLRITDIAHRLEMVRIMIQKLKCNVFMLSYRGLVSVCWFLVYLLYKLFVFESKHWICLYNAY